MSIFSNIRKSRQQAKEHSAKVAEQKKQESDTAPYKHVPTHAATDAYASAPPSWRESDRPKIAEQNRRRSAMAASGHHMNMVGIPRVGSSLSHVSYPTDQTSPMVRMRMPRAYSYNGVSPYPERSRDVLYSVPDLHYSEEPMSIKGKEALRGSGSDSQRISPTSSKGEHSPARSSSGSTSSQDGLEMNMRHPGVRPTGPAERVHRLHPSSRRNSDASERHAASLAKGAPVTVHQPSPRDPRPPASTRGFAAISPATALAPMPVSSQPRAPAMLATFPDANPAYASTTASRQSSTGSLPGLTPASSKPAPSNPVTPAAVPTAQPEFTLPVMPASIQTADFPSPGETTTYAAPVAKYKERRAPRMTRFTELERIESIVEPELPRADMHHAPAPVPPQQFVNAFPEPAAPLPEVAAPSSKSKSSGKKLTKGRGKLVKKSRWSSAESPAVAV